MRCDNNCVLRFEKRVNEVFCFQHGTVQFSRQANDLVENDLLEYQTYPPNFIWKAITLGRLTIDELARELNISKSTIKNSLSATKKERA